MLICGHTGQASDIRLCPHLVGQEAVDFWRVLRGDGMLYDCCCAACAKTFDESQSMEFVEVCSDCARKIEEQHWDMCGWLGSPTVEEFPVPFDDTLHEVIFVSEMDEASALLPLDSQRVLAFHGQQIGVFENTSFSPLATAQMPDDVDGNWGNHSLTPRFHLSPSGRYAALVNDFGRYGAVFDLEESRQTMNLDRGEYHPETQYFPCAFFSHDGRDLFVHATDWNRLEISDPRSGELLTAREAMNYEDKNSHYLNYFHGALHVSPDGKRIMDDGWVWHPVGVVYCWSLENWLKSNPYESEDGASKQELAYRSYFWNGPMCWIDNERVAIEGIGTDDEMMIRGAVIRDSSSGEQLAQFAGPSGEFRSDGTRLFSVEDDGLHLWDVETGARTGVIKGFRPQFQIDGALAQIEGNKMTLWNYG